MTISHRRGARGLLVALALILGATTVASAPAFAVERHGRGGHARGGHFRGRPAYGYGAPTYVQAPPPLVYGPPGPPAALNFMLNVR